MPDPAKYEMSFRPTIHFPTSACVRALLKSVQDKAARKAILEDLSVGACATSLLKEHLPTPGAEYVRQFIEGIEVAGITFGVDDAMVDYHITILVRQKEPGRLEYSCKDDVHGDLAVVASRSAVASLEEMIEILKAAIDHVFSPYGWPQAAFSNDPEVPYDPAHYCTVESDLYPELTPWLEDFVREYAAISLRSSAKAADGH
jgi:hypothetical protein